MIEILVDPSLVTVVGVASTDKKAVKSTETATKDKQKKKQSTYVKKSTTDAKPEAMDQKWSERFSRLGAFMLSKSLERSDPTFQTMKMPVKIPPGAVKVTEPFQLPKSADRPVDRPAETTEQALW